MSVSYTHLDVYKRQVLMTIINGSFGKNTIIIAFAGIFAGVILRMIFRYLTDINQSGVGLSLIHI